jgi:hypothetical protein
MLVLKRAHTLRFMQRLRSPSLAFVVGGVLLSMMIATQGFATSDPAKTVGANACAECHKQEVEAWKGSHHHTTFRNMPRNPKGKEIADRMGIRRVKNDSVCLGCHFTVQQKSGKPEAVSGISCESCHSAGQDWIKVHSGYSGKSAATESSAEKAARWKLASTKGMIRPRALYDLAKNCYGCHVVPKEDLVNKGGHRAGSAFELVSWSQGEVRHNTWTSKGKENTAASAARKRMLYLVGLGVELETALRAIAKATTRKPYAFIMAKRADEARKKLDAAAKAAPGVPEIAKLIELSRSAGLKLNNEAALNTAADSVASVLIAITEKYDGSTLAGLDPLIPGPNAYKGKAREAAAVK